MKRGKIHRSLCPNVSTTPITAMGCRQCLPLRVVQLKGKHCWKLHCHNGAVVDTFELCLGCLFATSCFHCNMELLTGLISSNNNLNFNSGLHLVTFLGLHFACANFGQSEIYLFEYYPLWIRYYQILYTAEKIQTKGQKILQFLLEALWLQLLK